MKQIGYSIKVLSESNQKVYRWLMNHGIPHRYAYFSAAYLSHETIGCMLFKARAMCRNSNAQVTLHGFFCAYMRIEFIKKEIYNFPYLPGQISKEHTPSPQLPQAKS